MARIAIVGVGAIGGVLAALLEVAGSHEVTLCTRRPLGRLRVTTPTGGAQVRARNITDPATAKPVDWVLVATKTYDVISASAWLPALTGGVAPVAVLQNGVEHRERFSSYVRPDLIIPVIIDCPVERPSDGNVLQRGPACMKLEAQPLNEEFAQLFAGSGAKVELTEDFLTAAWGKLCINSAGAISALVMKPAGVLRDEALGNVAIDIVAECVAVGQAEGARLADDTGRQVLQMYRAQPPDSINSMLADRISGRPMEIDARNGVIVRKGKKHGIATPANRMIVALLQSIGCGSCALPGSA